MNKNKAYLTQCISLTLSNICVWVNKPNIGKRGFFCASSLVQLHQHNRPYYQTKTIKTFKGFKDGVNCNVV
jgi:hypothetical protein